MAKPQYNTRQHKALRAQYRKQVDAGQGWCTELICLMPSRHISPGMPIDVAHSRDGGYLGPSHPKCNRAEGARFKASKARRPKRWIL